MKPRVSVIIPTRNEGRYLERTLKQYRSIKKKFNIEVIVSDGKSTDNTIKIANKYADRVVLAKKGVPTNISKGRNAGAKAASGSILFHTDADVIIKNKELFFKKIIKLFENPKVVAATTKLRIYPNEEKVQDVFFHFFINQSIKLSNYVGSFLAKGECQIVRADTFKKINGYDEKVVIGEDCNLFYRLRKKGKIVYLNDIVLYHSPRRFREEGYLKLLLFIYFREGISLLFRKRNFLSEWAPSR